MSTTAQKYFHFIESFGELQNPNNKVLIWMLEDTKNWNFLLVGHFNYFFFKTYLNQAETVRYKITGSFQKNNWNIFKQDIHDK